VGQGAARAASILVMSMRRMAVMAADGADLEEVERF
jgi:hypothetical protein